MRALAEQARVGLREAGDVAALAEVERLLAGHAGGR